MERKTNELWRASRRYRVYGLIWRQVVIRNVRCPLEPYLRLSVVLQQTYSVLSPCEWYCYIRVMRYLQVSLTSFTDNYKLSRWLENLFSISRHVLYVYWCKSAVRTVRKRRRYLAIAALVINDTHEECFQTIRWVVLKLSAEKYRSVHKEIS